MAKKQSVSIPEFHKMLVLAKWALGIFDQASFEPIQTALKSPLLEGLNEETGHTRFFHALTDFNLFYLGDGAKCTENELAAYDLRIVGYWKHITERRNAAEGTVYKLKYYQYLTLLVTELYLDWYFNRPVELLAEINAAIANYNATTSKEPLPAARMEELNKISFWEATGAGKTLMMDINILQYRFYAKEKPNHTILLTPDEGLTKQHIGELRLSNIQCVIISDENRLFIEDGYTVGVIDAGKIISDESHRRKGEKSFKTEEFESKNLVLVDEGHNGSSSVQGERRRVRAQLCRDGFTFEYSATFGQAVAKAGGADGAALRAEYARNILFDYSYKYFYEDGYGKNAFILNMHDAKDEERVFEYLCANLLKFVQQHAIFAHEEGVMDEFNIERPLCLFVGNTVKGKKDEEESLSDVETVIAFFARVLNERGKVEKLFDKFVRNKPVLVNDQGFNMLEQAFTPMFGWYGDGKSCYDAMLSLVMHSASAQRLKVTHLKGPDEIVLSVGLSSPFAVVHIGDSAGFIKKIGERKELDVMPGDEFSDSVFDGVNKKDSPINFLVGSRKFSQGWSCWRVSAMGLLNMGVSEGTQIIQLFGRGVRLKGKGYSLKRSLPRERPKGSFVEKLETLNVFGVRAEYMVTFRGYLNEEGITTEDSVITLKFEIKKDEKNWPKLETMEVEDGYHLNQAKGYKSQKAVLFVIPEGTGKKIKPPHVIYDDFSYLQSLQKGTSEKIGTVDEKGDVKIPHEIMRFFDWDLLYRHLLDAKGNRGYWNLEISKEKLITFATGDNGWYTLYSRPDDVRFDSFAKVGKMQAILQTLLIGYMDNFYKTFQKLFEDEHMVRKVLSSKQIPDEYVFQIENNPEGKVWEKRLKELRAIIAKGEVTPADRNKWSRGDFVAIFFDRHLYSPLFYTTKGKQLPFRLRPVTFDSPSELQFVRDLMAFYSDARNADFFKGVDLYLMRNPANKTKGIGFAQAANFYPDFMLWLIDKKSNRQYLGFIDPKGLVYESFESPKLNFSTQIKALQATVNAKATVPLILNSVILSDTPYFELAQKFVEHTKEEYEAKNVFFLNEGDPVDGVGGGYLPKMFAALMKE